MMILKMDEKAYEYLYSKNKSITIDLLVPAGCCGGTMVPNVIFNKPKNPERYILLIHKDLHLFVSKSMEFRDNVVEIVLKKKLFLKDLEFPTLKMF